MKKSTANAEAGDVRDIPAGLGFASWDGDRPPIPVPIPVPPTLTPPLALSRRYRGLTLVLTFLCYTSYHLSRKPISIVKVSSNLAPAAGRGDMGVLEHPDFTPSLSPQSQLHPNCSALGPNPHNDSNSSTWCSWAPFGKAELPQSPQKLPSWQPRQAPPHALNPVLAGGWLLIRHVEVIKQHVSALCPRAKGQQWVVNSGPGWDRVPAPVAPGHTPRTPTSGRRVLGMGDEDEPNSHGEGKQDGGQADVALIFLFQMGTTTRSFSGRWIMPSWWPTPSGCLSGTQVLCTPFPPCTSLHQSARKLVSIGLGSC